MKTNKKMRTGLKSFCYSR